MHRSSFLLELMCFFNILVAMVCPGNPSLECFTDYLSNITCSLNISAESLSNASSSWLHFSTDDDEHFDCTLKRGKQSLLCEMDLSQWHIILNDADRFKISLCYHGNNFSVVLDDVFVPSQHIRPLPPSNLSLLWEKDRVLFQWQSGYDPYDPDNIRSDLISNLQYQLSVYSDRKLHVVQVVDHKVYMDKFRFEPHRNYTVRVRSQPDQVAYSGVWSLWAPALHWRSGDIHKETPERSFHTAWIFLLLLLLLVPLVCISYSRWRKHDFIPSPAPYFRDWDVDVQMLSSKMRDVLEGEESLQIDILTESTDTPPQLTLVYKTSDQDDLTPQSPSVPHSPVWSEGDSGCWIRDFVATERGSITCSEDYCTLSNSHTYAV